MEAPTVSIKPNVAAHVSGSVKRNDGADLPSGEAVSTNPNPAADMQIEGAAASAETLSSAKRKRTLDVSDPSSAARSPEDDDSTTLKSLHSTEGEKGRPAVKLTKLERKRRKMEAQAGRNASN